MQYEQVYGIFASIENAERAISALKDHGVSGNEISVVRRSDGAGLPAVSEGGSTGFTTTTAEDATAGALKGGAVGVALGILAGAVALTIPGVGPILAAGPLWAAFGVTVAAGAAGAISGGVIGYLVDQGVPHEMATVYGAAISRGDVLISVRSEHLTAGDAVLVLEKYGATEVGRHPVDALPDGVADPALVDRTIADREMMSNGTVIPIIPPITPSMPGLPGPIGR